jgi:hypothetical protein
MIIRHTSISGKDQYSGTLNLSAATLGILPFIPNMHGLFYNQREMTVMILQNSVLGPDPKLGSSGDAKDYVAVLMAHISTRK